MKRGRRMLALLFLLCVLLTIASSALWIAHRPPRYNGKSLTEWATLYQKSFWPRDPFVQTQAVYAAHQTRDQLVPYALKLLQQQPSTWRTGLVRNLAISGLTRWIPRNLWNSLYSDPGSLSPTYFAMLGSDANSAIPELLSLLKQTNSGPVGSRAIYALCYTGKSGQARLAEILVDPGYPHKRRAAYIIEDVKKQGVIVSDLIPSLVKNLAESNHETAKATAYSLGEMAIEPDIVIPALTNCLQSTDIYVRGAALDALAKYGANARTAIPALITELDDPDPSVRKWATHAMKSVAPEYFSPVMNFLTTPLAPSTP